MYSHTCWYSLRMSITWNKTTTHNVCLFVCLFVAVEMNSDLSLGVWFVGEGPVPLLPQKLPRSEERLRVLEFPPLQAHSHTTFTHSHTLNPIPHSPIPPTTTLHHWLILMGKSLCDWTHLAMAGYITVSEVGRTAIGSASSVLPLLVTQATWKEFNNSLPWQPVTPDLWSEVGNVVLFFLESSF